MLSGWRVAAWKRPRPNRTDYAMNKKQFKYDVVSDSILNMIATGKYKPGDKLPPEAELTRQFAVSRVTLRESLKKLSMMGVLSIVQGSGTFVKEITPASFMKPLFPLLAFKGHNVEEVYTARIYLESGACELAATHRDESDVDALQDLIGRMAVVIGSDDLTAYSPLDHAFHLALARACKNEIISMVFGLFWNFIEGYMPRINSSRDVVARSFDSHRQICQAIAWRRPELAAVLMREHLLQAKQNLLAAMEAQQRPEHAGPKDEPNAGEGAIHPPR